MRVPRVQFTVRRMMVVVAVVALILGAVVLVERRRDRFRGLAHRYSLEERATQGVRITNVDVARDPLILAKIRAASDSFRRGSGGPPITKEDVSRDPSMAIIKQIVDTMDLDRRDVWYRGRRGEYYRRLKEKYHWDFAKSG